MSNNDIVEFFKAYEFPDKFMEAVSTLDRNDTPNKVELKFLLSATKDGEGRMDFTVNPDGDRKISILMRVFNRLPLKDAVVFYIDSVSLPLDTNESSFRVEEYGFDSEHHFYEKLTELQEILRIISDD